MSTACGKVTCPPVRFAQFVQLGQLGERQQHHTTRNDTTRRGTTLASLKPHEDIKLN